MQNVQNCSKFAKLLKMYKCVQNLQSCAKSAKVCKICKVVQNMQNCANISKMCKVVQNVQDCAKCLTLHQLNWADWAPLPCVDISKSDFTKFVLLGAQSCTRLTSFSSQEQRFRLQIGTGSKRGQKILIMSDNVTIVKNQKGTIIRGAFKTNFWKSLGFCQTPAPIPSFLKPKPHGDFVGILS